MAFAGRIGESNGYTNPLILTVNNSGGGTGSILSANGGLNLAAGWHPGQIP